MGVCVYTCIYIHICIFRQHFFVNANFIKHNRHFMPTYFLDPFKKPTLYIHLNVSDNNNIYVGLTSTTLSRRLTMHLSDTSSIAQHVKKTFMPNNTTTKNSHRQHNNTRTSK